MIRYYNNEFCCGVRFAKADAVLAGVPEHIASSGKIEMVAGVLGDYSEMFDDACDNQAQLRALDAFFDALETELKRRFVKASFRPLRAGFYARCPIPVR